MSDAPCCAVYRLIAAGVGCAGLFLGTRYILRAQERVRRRRAGLPEDDDIDEYDQEDHYDRGAHHAQRQVSQILGVDFGTTNLRLAVAAMNAAPTSQSVRVLETADGFRSLTAAVAVDNGATSVGPVAQSLLGRKPGYTATAIRVLLDQSKPNVRLCSQASTIAMAAAYLCTYLLCRMPSGSSFCKVCRTRSQSMASTSSSSWTAIPTAQRYMFNS